MRLINRILYWLAGGLLFISLFLNGSIQLDAEKNMDEKRVIRVTYPEQFGFTEINSQGEYCGYTYDYLMRIAQNRGWEIECVPYEFSNQGISQGLADLREGKIDVVGAMVYSQELSEQYEFSSSPYGYTNFVLLSTEENMELNRRTIYDYPDLKVALVEGAEGQNQLFDNYCKEQEIDYTPIYFESKEACIQMVENGEADALISKNVVPTSGFKMVISYGTQPFHFATRKGDMELIKAINEEIDNITIIDPNYQFDLFQKYFVQDYYFSLALTSEERQFIQQGNKVKVAIVQNVKPIQHYDQRKKKYSGIMVDVLSYVTEKCGLEFELIPAENYKDAKSMINNGQVDVVAGVPYSYQVAQRENILLSSPIVNIPIVKVTNSSGKNDGTELLLSPEISAFYSAGQNTKIVDDIKEILGLVENEKYDSAYLNSYTAQHYAEEGGLTNLYMTIIPNETYQISFGISKNCDASIIGILNQAIACITPKEEEELLYRNTMTTHKVGLMSMLRSNPLEIIIIIVFISVLILLLVLALFLKSKKLNKHIYMEKVKFEQISQLDRLTHTYNNISFKLLVKEFLEHLGKTNNIKGALLICDIDDFKEVNDTYGHLKGDKVIEALGRTMINTFYENCIVGRIGGDEMAVFMKNIEDIEIVSSKCQELLEHTKLIDKDLALSVSVGVKIFDSQISFEELFEQADAILYKVKEHGKNSFLIE